MADENSRNAALFRQIMRDAGVSASFWVTETDILMIEFEHDGETLEFSSMLEFTVGEE